MASLLFFDKTPVANFSGLVSSYRPDEFASPTRSTVPLLAMVRDAPQMLADLLEQLGSTKSSELHFEYTVQSPRGRGRPSHTDVMAISGHSRLALEFKWTEPRYETVHQWLGQDPEPPNKAERLAGWLSLLQRQAIHRLRLEDFYPAVYQMVHRAASACESQGRAGLGYVIFRRADSKADVCDEYLSDLRLLRGLLGGCPDFPFHLVEVTVAPTSRFEQIEFLRKGSGETKTAVADAVRNGRLFEFQGIRSHLV